MILLQGDCAIELNRDFIGIEISEKYYNLSKERLNNMKASKNEQL